MLAYAFRALREDGFQDIAGEDFSNTGDLFACIVAKGVSGLIKRGLCRDYQELTGAVSVPKGKICISASLRQKSQARRDLVCSFDEYTENTLYNQLLKTTMLFLVKSDAIKKEYKDGLKKALMYLSHVDTIPLHKIKWSHIRYNRNNAVYEMLINICYLVLKGMLMDDGRGQRRIRRYLDDERMHRLYEKFILEFYRKHYHEKLTASPSHIEWAVDDGVCELLPTMKSDITLKSKDGSRTLIIDAKYYSKTFQQYYDKNTYISANLYQIFTYVKNYSVNDFGTVGGLLLYARTDVAFVPDSSFMLSGNEIQVRTLDLNTDFKEIEGQLANIVNYYFMQ